MRFLHTNSPPSLFMPALTLFGEQANPNISTNVDVPENPDWFFGQPMNDFTLSVLHWMWNKRVLEMLKTDREGAREEEETDDEERNSSSVCCNYCSSILCLIPHVHTRSEHTLNIQRLQTCIYNQVWFIHSSGMSKAQPFESCMKMTMTMLMNTTLEDWLIYSLH